MKAAALRQTLCGVMLTFVLIAAFARGEAQQVNQPTTLSTVANRMLERRTVDAVIWGMPMVSLDALRQAYFRDGKARYGDIIWWPK